MRKKIRKKHPSPPHWWLLDSDNCWWCRNKSGCSNCKALKQFKRMDKGK